jgi:hypothetical protein
MRSFESIGDEWLAAVEAEHIGRRRGRGKPYSGTTLVGYRGSYSNGCLARHPPVRI